MAKKIIKRITKHPLNLYDLGGTVSGTASAVEGIVDSSIKNAQISDTTQYGADIKKQNSLSFSGNNDTLLNDFNNIKRLNNVSYKDVRGISNGQQASNILSATAQGTAAGATIGSIIPGLGTVVGAGIGASVGLIGSSIGSIIGNNKAKRRENDLNRQINDANTHVLNNYNTAVSATDNMNDFNTLANYSAYGGPLNTYSQGGSIHINPENKGKLTATSKRTGKSFSELAHSKNPLTRKRAIFALNARKWHHHDEGGYLYDNGGNLYLTIPNEDTHGGEFSNGVTVINNGGTHEENPYQGVPMGMDNNGIPNLVEEGEVKWKDYIFSNRLSPSKQILQTLNLSTNLDNKSYAKIAEDMNDESSERPNDPISQNGLNSNLSKLQEAQEITKALQKDKEDKKRGIINRFDEGGNLVENDANPYLYTQLTNSYNPYNLYNISDNLQSSSTFHNNSQNDNLIGQSNEISYQSKSNDYTSNGINEKNSFTDNLKNFNTTNLRYAPVVGSGIQTLTDLVGLTNKPDYTNAKRIENSVSNLSNVNYKPIGDYLSYNPFDRNYYINKLDSNTAATRNFIRENSGLNRATATAGILAADYNYTQGLGELARKADEYNLAQKQQVATFNRGTNEYNSEADMKAQLANKANEELRFKAYSMAAQMRENERLTSDAAKSSNRTNFFDNLGKVGKEQMSREMINSNPAYYYNIDNNGTVHYKPEFYDLSPENQLLVNNYIKQQNNKPVDDNNKSKAKGGYLILRGGL